MFDDFNYLPVDLPANIRTETQITQFDIVKINKDNKDTNFIAVICISSMQVTNFVYVLYLFQTADILEIQQDQDGESRDLGYIPYKMSFYLIQQIPVLLISASDSMIHAYSLDQINEELVLFQNASILKFDCGVIDFNIKSIKDQEIILFVGLQGGDLIIRKIDLKVGQYSDVVRYFGGSIQLKNFKYEDSHCLLVCSGLSLGVIYHDIFQDPNSINLQNFTKLEQIVDSALCGCYSETYKKLYVGLYNGILQTYEYSKKEQKWFKVQSTEVGWPILCIEQVKNLLAVLTSKGLQIFIINEEQKKDA